MPDATLACPDCRASYASADNYCRQCGMFLVGVEDRALTRVEPRALAEVRPGLPAPVKKMATAVVVGSALQIGLGIVGRYLASQGARKVARAAVAKPSRGNKGQVLAVQAEQPMTAVSETVVIRRVWLRRG